MERSCLLLRSPTRSTERAILVPPGPFLDGNYGAVCSDTCLRFLGTFLARRPRFFGGSRMYPTITELTRNFQVDFLQFSNRYKRFPVYVRADATLKPEGDGKILPAFCPLEAT